MPFSLYTHACNVLAIKCPDYEAYAESKKDLNGAGGLAFGDSDGLIGRQHKEGNELCIWPKRAWKIGSAVAQKTLFIHTCTDTMRKTDGQAKRMRMSRALADFQITRSRSRSAANKAVIS